MLHVPAKPVNAELAHRLSFSPLLPLFLAASRRHADHTPSASIHPSIYLSPTARPPIRRAQNHIRHLLELTAQFPRANPSAAEPEHAAELDIPRLFRQIRSRYKLLCATLGVRPALRAADGSAPSPERAEDAVPGPAPVKRGSVWAVHDARAGGGGEELSF